MKMDPLGTCLKQSDVAFIKASCVSGFFVYESYSDACSGKALSTVTHNCMKSAKKEEWVTYKCDADITGYHKMGYAQYTSGDCSGDPALSMDMAVEMNVCAPAAKFEEGKWTAKSTKTIKSGTSLTMQEFPTMDCSGSPIETKTTCGGCFPTDGKNASLTCGNLDGEPEVSGAVQPSCILPALLLWAAAEAKSHS